METIDNMKARKFCWLILIVAILSCSCVLGNKDGQTSGSPLNSKDSTEQTDTCTKSTDCNSDETLIKSNEKTSENELDIDTGKTEHDIVITDQQLNNLKQKTENQGQSTIVDENEIEDIHLNNKKDEMHIEDEEGTEPVNHDHSRNDGGTEEEKSNVDQLTESIQLADVKLQSNSSNSSVIYDWFKYFVDSFLEEFKEGVISKQPEKENKTNSSETDVAINESIALNVSDEIITPDMTQVNQTNQQNSTENGKKTKFECVGRNVTDNINATVKIITSAKLLQLISVIDKNDTENTTDCLVVLFYAPWCQFCARTAPHFNALARAFPQLDFVAVDTAQFSNLLARFGTVSVPNVIVFHQSRSTVKFNQTERVFTNYVSFLQNATGLEPNSSVEITEEDYVGPVPSVPTDDPDYLLLLSWVFVLFCSTCIFIKSTKGQQWITRVRVLWQEHQHID